MVNGHAMAHGGLIFALADTAFACACNSFGPVTVAASAEIVFVAPARAGDVLVAEAVSPDALDAAELRERLAGAQQELADAEEGTAAQEAAERESGTS
jgi:uncharacterized protein (TIGR00369 family)